MARYPGCLQPNQSDARGGSGSQLHIHGRWRPGGGNRILKVNSIGILTRVAGGGATQRDEVPATYSFVSTYGGISVDAAGNIYSADWYGNVIRKITTDGIIHTIAGTGKMGRTDGCGVALAALFYGPEDVAADGAGCQATGSMGTGQKRKYARITSANEIGARGSPRRGSCIFRLSIHGIAPGSGVVINP